MSPRLATIAPLMLPLALAACDAPPPEAAVSALADGQAAPPPSLVTEDILLGGQFAITVTGAPPNTPVFIARSLAGVGSGPCPPFLNGACFDLRNQVQLHAQTTTNANGRAVVRTNVPVLPALQGQQVCFQAVVPGSPATLSNADCGIAGLDSDGDGVLDPLDACPGSDDWFDWDDDGVPDGCDVGAGVPPVFDTAAYSFTLESGVFQNRNYLQVIPPNPVGLIWVFHGTGGGADLVDGPEVIALLETFVARGYAFVAFDSENRASKVWNHAAGPATNPDWSRLTAYRSALIGAGDISASTPLFGLSFSAGGPFASYAGHAALAAGLPWRGAAYHNSTARSDFYGLAPNVPTAWVANVNDTAVEPVLVENKYLQHIGAGFPGVYVLQQEERFAPTRFARTTFYTQEESIAVFREAVDAGFFDKQGHWLQPRTNIEDVIDDIVLLPSADPDPAGRGVLRAMMRTHVLTAGSAVEEADYFDDQL